MSKSTVNCSQSGLEFGGGELNMTHQYNSSYLSTPWQWVFYIPNEVKVISQKKMKMIKEKWWQLDKLKRTLQITQRSPGDLQYKYTKDIFSLKKEMKVTSRILPSLLASSPKLFW